MDAILKLSGVAKSFPGVRALDGVDLEIDRGEVHALLGENGAGKSTLVKLIAGVYRRDAGTVIFEGRERHFGSPGEAALAGIVVIHQETSLIPTLTVMENVFLGMEYRVFPGVIDNRRARKEFEAACRRLGFDLPPQKAARDLSVAEQKMVEIVKSMVRKASLLIMDEPTDALTATEIEHLFRIIGELRRRSVTVIYITHFLEEVFRIADRLTVLRDGRKVDTRRVADLDRDAVVRMMIGQELAASDAPRPPAGRGGEAIRVEGLSRGRSVVGVSFAARRGEILGITGVLGSGKTELARLLFGADRPDRGRIWVGGEERRIGSPAQAVALGIGMLPEDRKRQGLILSHELYRNVSIASLGRLSRWMVVRGREELAETARIVRALGIHSTGPRQQVRYLSGGNQQKVVLAKWLVSRQKILIMDEPTRGIDVGSKAEIHRLVRRLAEEGTCIIFISSEVPEMVKVADRVLVMQGGRLAAELGRGVSQEQVIQRMLKGNGT
jgi:ribose transport system ATP-binding protein